MTHPNSVTNGASLEDCHTNFFALADLCGIKWRRLTTGENYLPSSPDPLDDPVLTSYSKCLSADLLCVWCRVINNRGSSGGLGHDASHPNAHQNRPGGNPMDNASNQQVQFGKELMIFWYGGEPDLSDLISNELTEIEQGSWEIGLSYECRTLLFKALHNLIERCLLAKGFARLGKWFVQPQDCSYSAEKQNPNVPASSSFIENSEGNASTQLTFAFNFFVHGESTVCASVDVRQHPPVYRINKSHLTIAQGSSSTSNVILSPYGLSGTLTGQSCRENDPSVQKLLNEWKQFYPVQYSKDGHQHHGKNYQATTFQVDSSESSDGPSCTNSAGPLPSVVEVIVAGVKMKYPSCYVYIASNPSIKERENKQKENENSVEDSEKSSAELNKNAISFDTSKDILSSEPKLKMPVLSPRQPLKANSSFRLNSGTNQELSCQSMQKTVSSSGQSPDESSSTFWTFSDPCTKVNCMCYRCRSKKSSSQNSGSKTGLSVSQSSCGSSKKGDKNEKQSTKLTKNSIPFHRRILSSDSLIPLDLLTTENNTSNNISENTATNSNSQLMQPKTPSFPYKSPAGPGGLPSLQSISTPLGNNIDSPRSIIAPCTNEGPASAGGFEGNLCSVSPHPVKEDPCSQPDPNCPGPSPVTIVAKEKSHLEQLLSPYQPIPSVKGANPSTSDDPPSVGGGSQWTPGAQSSMSDVETAVYPSITSGPEVSSAPNGDLDSGEQAQGVKRPSLPISLLEITDVDTSKSLLYDYSSVHAATVNWDLPPAKHRRIIESSYEINRPVYSKVRQDCPNDIDMIVKTQKDPYEFSEFDDEFSVFKAPQEERFEGPLAINSSESSNAQQPPLQTNQTSNSLKETSKSNINSSGVDIAASPLTPQTKPFTREEELVVSYRDLEQIFDTSSGDESNEEMLPAPSLPQNNLNKSTNLLNGHASSVSCISSEELIKSSKGGNINTTSASILGVAELTRMFPTPPSLEHNTAPSPCNTFGGNDATLIDEISAREKIDIYPSSPISLENSKDWSFVYVPPVQYKFIASSKYAPLPNVPSLPAIQLPADSTYKPVIQQQPPRIVPQHQPHKLEPSGYAHQQPGPLPSMQQSSQGNVMHHPQMPVHRAAHSHIQPQHSLQYPHQMMGTRITSPSIKGNYGPQLHHVGPQSQISPHLHNQNQFSPAGYIGSIERHPNNFQSNDRGITSHMSPHMYPYHHPLHQNHQHQSPHPVQATNNNGQQSSMTFPYEVACHQSSFMRRHTQESSNASVSTGSLEAHSLLINLVLSDSIMNLFKDHNFESCTLCVCNMNIKGSDVGVYLPEVLMVGGSDELQYKCTCGFSAASNRHRSLLSGLFYEDELEVTGVLYDPVEGYKKKSLATVNSKEPRQLAIESSKEFEGESLNPALVDLLKTQCSAMLSSVSIFSKAYQFEAIKRRELLSNLRTDSIMLNNLRVANRHQLERTPQALLRSDGCDLTFIALLSGKQALDYFPNKMMLSQHNTTEKVSLKGKCLHSWPFFSAKLPPSNLEITRFLRHLQPFLQESVQKKPQAMWEVTYTVSGPLTWRQFHRLAGRGTEDQCEPQPIPSLLVGHDKDWACVSPFALKYWEKLMLEPFSVTRDVAYVVVAPDDSYVLDHVRSFFKDLSSTYEILRLGRHCPMTNVLREGIFRVGKKVAKQVAEDTVDDWFNQLGDDDVSSKLKLYAQACKSYLCPVLKAQPMDRSLFDNSQQKQQTDSSNNVSLNQPPMKSQGASPMPQTEPQTQSESRKEEFPNETSHHGSNMQAEPSEIDDDPSKQPVMVIYIIEPFTFANLDENLYRLSCLGLLRCYAYMLLDLPEQLQNSIHLQLVSLDAVTGNIKDFNGSKRLDQLKSLSLAVFTQARKTVSHQPISKSLTGFGPAASLELFLRSKDKRLNFSRVYTPPYILAPQKDKQTELGEMFGDKREKSNIFYCSYCLSEDQKWLIGSCTNDKGDLLETTLINIEIPNRTRRKKASVRKYGLHRLMEFALSVMAVSVQPWRLVIGRVGKVGHGELKEWACLLSKKSLLRYCRRLKEMCRQCNIVTHIEMPAILSACLVSLEPDSTLRVFPDQFTPDERFNRCGPNNCTLSTPEDASCTHILVFPTSATTQSSHGNFQIDPLGANIDDDLLQALGADDDLAVDDGINDIFQWGESPPPSPSMCSPRRDGLSHPDSPSLRQMNFDGSGQVKSSNGGESLDEPLQLLQQPLALGYYVSTAQTGSLPKWFWSSCPQLEEMRPAFLKSALLIHVPSVQQTSDDLLHSNIKNYHPLDSNLTTDVLRYVLEGYNALSWLSLDPSTHDRTSCLPLQIQILMQLYHTVQALV